MNTPFSLVTSQYVALFALGVYMYLPIYKAFSMFKKIENYLLVCKLVNV